MWLFRQIPIRIYRPYKDSGWRVWLRWRQTIVLKGFYDDGRDMELKREWRGWRIRHFRIEMYVNG
jgi:hypothetical protein